jgi:serine/threonine-protein kinase RsbW
MTMCEFDTAQTYGIALQLDTVLREEFVEFTYSLSSDVKMVSPFIDQLVRKINILRPMDGTDVDMEVALREALLNAVVHGNREDPSKRIYLRVRCRADGEVSMAIRDEGAGFEIDSVPDPTAPEQLMSTHGRGIYLMRALMDEVSFHDGGTVVQMRKRASLPNYQAG